MSIVCLFVIYIKVKHIRIASIIYWFLYYTACIVNVQYMLREISFEI